MYTFPLAWIARSGAVNKIDKILLILGSFMLLFVLACLWLFHEHGSEPSTLITVIGGAVIAEVIALCAIKIDGERTSRKKKVEP